VRSISSQLLIDNSSDSRDVLCAMCGGPGFID
jgi:hypothetical protein